MNSISRRRRKILIVDDNPELAAMFNAFDDVDFEFIIASGGIDALKYLEDHPDMSAILVDLSMPVLDGIACVEEIRRNEMLHPNKPEARLAFFTAVDIDSVIERVQRRNYVEKVFAKPMALDELVKKIKEWLDDDVC